MINLSQESFAAEVDKSSTPDDNTVEQIVSLDGKKALAEIDNYTQNTKERKKYADLIFQFTCFWCLFVGFIILCNGIGTMHHSDLVLTTILGSTTVNVLVFFRIVTRYLFNHSKSN